MASSGEDDGVFEQALAYALQTIGKGDRNLNYVLERVFGEVYCKNYEVWRMRSVPNPSLSSPSKKAWVRG